MTTDVGAEPAAAGASPAWQDSSLSPHERAEALLVQMTRAEKLGQLVGLWVGADASGAGVAPNQEDRPQGLGWEDVIVDGLGQLSRAGGAAPGEPARGVGARAQRERHERA